MDDPVELSEHDQPHDALELVRLLAAEDIPASAIADSESTDLRWVVRVAANDMPAADRVLSRFLAGPTDNVTTSDDVESEWGWVDYSQREPRAVFDFDCDRRAAKPLRPDRLVEVIAYATPIEADLVRERLASEGIQSCLGNEAVIQWCWIFFSAIRGMRVFVMSEHRDRALDVIREMKSADKDDEPAERWTCDHCDQSVPGDWSVCWACGTDREGVRDDAFEIASAPGQPLIEERFDGGPLPVWLAVLVACCPPVIIMYALTKLVFYARDATEIAETELEAELREFREREPRGLLDTVDDEPISEQLMYDAIVTRAMRAAVFGYFVAFDISGWVHMQMYFPVAPLLTVYSIWLLHCRHRYVWDVSPNSDWRVSFAFALNLQLPIWITFVVSAASLWR